MTGKNIYTYKRWDGRDVDLSILLTVDGATKESVAAQASGRERMHALCAAVRALRESGYSANEIGSIAKAFGNGHFPDGHTY